MPGAPRAAAGPRGQHFLRPEPARRLVAAAGVQPGDLVFDLGAGTGALTFLLAARAGRVVAIERDPKLARRLARRAPANVSVHERDLATMWFPHRPFRVVANLPFAGSNAVIRRLLQRDVPLVGADLVVELGVARRWTERSARCTVDRVLPPSAFVPAPRCTAAVLRIR
ncbi:MAG TPA: rRNA adenine N-6-methyltransferase family protein [Acidimicrobiales bacterium]|nr:rRNA adenine N-6-methyltransferase family protein [Acidimicrobiales bacterium]